MLRNDNPFSPGAGTQPPELVGRAAVLEDAAVLLSRVKAGRSEKSILLTGLRGVGKTVLLNEVERLAAAAGYAAVKVEAQEARPLAGLLVPSLRLLMAEFSATGLAAHWVHKGMAALTSFVRAVRIKTGDVEFGIDLAAAAGVADSGDLEQDLQALLEVIAGAAKAHGSGVALVIDELQYLGSGELGALIMALHRMQQRQLPLVLVGAGLPTLPALAGDAKSYAERLFNFPVVGALDRDDADRALRDPLTAGGVGIEQAALDEVYRVARGYPYFIQEWGYQMWNIAESKRVTLDVARRATPLVQERLDGNFFRVRYDRLTPAERRMLRAMADLGQGPYRTAEVAERLGVKLMSVGPRRAKLIAKGMIYSPAYGDLAFTVPMFDEFMRRSMPEFP